MSESQIFNKIHSIIERYDSKSSSQNAVAKIVAGELKKMGIKVYTFTQGGSNIYLEIEGIKGSTLIKKAPFGDKFAVYSSAYRINGVEKSML